MKTRLPAVVLVASLAFLLPACDTPAEQATEERVEDSGEAAGQDEDVAEQSGEAAKEGDTAATGTTATSETTVTTATTATTGT